jgi:hypothetical protein
MSDPTKAEPRNPTYGGETAQESVDRMAGSRQGPNDGGAKGPMVPPRPAPANIHPSSVGGHSYGAPIGDVILK